MSLATMLDGRGDDRDFDAEWNEFLLADRELYEQAKRRHPNPVPDIGNIALKRAVFDNNLDVDGPLQIDSKNDPYHKLGSFGLKQRFLQ